MNKILVVGGVAGGMSAAARCRRLDEDAEIIVLEKGAYVSFSNCSLPYHLSDTIPDASSLILMTPESLHKSHNLDVRVHQEVTQVQAQDKLVWVEDLETGKKYSETYDHLILSPGAEAISPPIPGLDSVPHSFLRTVGDSRQIHDECRDKGVKDVVILGGGFIGIEAAENLTQAGYQVHLVEALDQVLNIFDYDMVQILEKELYDQGVDLHLGQLLKEFKEGKAVLEDGSEVPCDFLILAAGVRPATEFLKDSGVDLDDRGFILVDENLQTSAKDVYAIGDAIQVYNWMSGKHQPLQLAGPAQKQARRLANFIYGKPSLDRGFLGSACVKVFDFNGGVTGLTCKQLEDLGRTNYDSVLVLPKDSVSLMPNSQDQFLKVVYELPTGRVLGAQAIGKGDVIKRVDAIAAMLKFNPTVEDLMDFEGCYAPPFALARDSINFAGYVADNLLKGVYRQVHVDQVRDLVEEGAYFLDVREVDEYAQGHVKGAVNIPLSQLRDRMEEVPKDRPVYLYCRTGQRSYYALMALKNSGWDKLYNVGGSFLAISYYEYVQDKLQGRDPIVTDYNFD